MPKMLLHYQCDVKTVVHTHTLITKCSE